MVASMLISMPRVVACVIITLKVTPIMVKIKTWPNRPEDCQNHILGFLLNLSAECS